MNAHLRVAMYLLFIRTFKTKFGRLLYIREGFFYRLTLAITANKRWINCNEEAVFILLDDDWEPAMWIVLFHWIQYREKLAFMQLRPS